MILVQLESALRGSRSELAGEPGDDYGRRTVMHQNAELRRRLEEEQSTYRRKLQLYQDGQQRQALLVQKLQAKVS